MKDNNNWVFGIGLGLAFYIWAKSQQQKAEDGLGDGTIGSLNQPTPQEVIIQIPKGSIQYVPVYPYPDIQQPKVDTEIVPEQTISIDDTTQTPSFWQNFKDTLVNLGLIGGSLGFSLGLSALPTIGTSFLAKRFPTATQEIGTTPFKRLISDPYGFTVNKQESQLMTGLATETLPKWAKTMKVISNYVPFVDVPVGIGLDMYFSRQNPDPSKHYSLGVATFANVMGEAAQIATTLGLGLPSAGAGAVPGWILGGAADIATTEAIYEAFYKGTSLWSFLGIPDKPIYSMKFPQMGITQLAQQSQDLAKIDTVSTQPVVQALQQAKTSGGYSPTSYKRSFGGSSQQQYSDAVAHLKSIGVGSGNPVYEKLIRASNPTTSSTPKVGSTGVVGGHKVRYVTTRTGKIVPAIAR